MATSSRDEEDLILQTRFHIKFANLRAGIIAEASSRQVRAALADQSWRRRPRRNLQPRSAIPNFVYPPRGVLVEDAAALADQTVLYQRNGRVRLTETQRREGAGVVARVARHLAKEGFLYYRTLGWGGEGVAALMYVVDATGLPPRKVVAKMSLRENNGGFYNERGLSKRFVGQYHMLQRQSGSDLTVGDQQIAEMDEALRAAESRLMLLEYAQFGSLASLLKKVSDPLVSRDDPLGIRATQGGPLPDRALMHIFQCLASACEDMRAPGVASPSVLLGLPTERNPIVHFDLEPTNMLFGGAEAVVQAEHTMMPILKVADLGLAEPIPSDLTNDRNDDLLWQLRWRAKDRYFLPEQFSQDWDYSDDNPVAENIDTYGQVAGDYGPASNVYHIGLALWSCITGTWTQLPTDARLRNNPIHRADGRSWWTWWSDILDNSKYGTVDRQIRETVVACLAEEPSSRIDSHALLSWCSTKIAQLRQMPGSTDADLLAWATASFSVPPEPTSSTPLPLFDPSNPSNDQIDPFDPKWVL